MQTTDGDWKDSSSHLRDLNADDITIPETPGLPTVDNNTSNLKSSEVIGGSNSNSDAAKPQPQPSTEDNDSHTHGGEEEDEVTTTTIIHQHDDNVSQQHTIIDSPYQAHDSSGPVTPNIHLIKGTSQQQQHHHQQHTSSQDVPTFETCSNGESDDIVTTHIKSSSIEEVEVNKSQSQESTTDTSKRTDAKRPFDCNVCFDLATDPVVTRCGHLYCWPCLHAWLKQASECPVCKAQVTKETVVPIYGQGEDAVDPRNKAQADSEIPERPRPERVEATRRRSPNQSTNAAWNLSMFAGTSLSFGIFPIGVGVTWPGTWFNNQAAPASMATSEEIFSQLLSLAFLFVAIFVTLGIVFVGDHSPEF